MFFPTLQNRLPRPFARLMVCATIGFGLTACGGGKGASPQDAPTSTEFASPATYQTLKPATRAEAARFLTQSTYGPIDSEVDRVMSIGYDGWIRGQLAQPLPQLSYFAYWDQRNQAISAADPHKRAGPGEVINSFWRLAVTSDDQLRQRMAFALSQIFVVSSADGCGGDHPEGIASYMDMLSKQAFGSFRSLIEAVALHPMMGCYLSHLRNQKEDPVTGRVPDENFAREVMQLFSIGLYQLNMDGSLRRDGAGNPIETYSPDDVAGLAKVFTGYSWDCPEWPSDNCFRNGVGSSGAQNVWRYTVPMKPYPQFHSVSEKRFLGVVIPVQSKADPNADLKTALDTIASHPNVAPFIAKQIIQRFVTSNPSAQYVERAATAFKNSGLNFGSLLYAVLLDPEARNISNSNANFGKIKEPVLRITEVMRAMGAKSATGSFLISYDDGAPRTLAQIPTRSPSVFNFYRPGYVAPGSISEQMGLVAPEQQILNETTVAGYVNYMRDLIAFGVGSKGYFGTAASNDIQLDFNVNPSNSLLSLANDPAVLVENLNQKLMYGTMPDSLKADIVAAIGTIDYRAKTNPTADQIFSTQQRRVWAALLLAVSSPEFQVQL